MKLNEIKNSKLRALIKFQLESDRYSKPKRNRQGALDREISFAQGMVDITGPLIIRITRIYQGKEYDDDNFIGGCKQLRDAIAAALSRKGDSEKDGLRWEYIQKVGEPEIKIEVFKDEMQCLQ